MRSKYIYLIYCGKVLISAHTVKHEAHTWLLKSPWTVATAELYRMPDGVQGKGHTKIDWEDKLFNANHLTRASSQVADWPEGSNYLEREMARRRADAERSSVDDY